MDLIDTHEWLKSLSHAEVVKLAEFAGVSKFTLYKIAREETEDPGVKTLAKVAEARAAYEASVGQS